MQKIVSRFLVFSSLALLLAGCSFGQSSYSSSSPCRSSSRSSKGSGEEVRATQRSYQEEVASLVVIYVGSQGESENFHRELADIASRNGINDWANDQGTFVAIGKGLKRAKVPQNAIQYLTFLHGIKALPLYSAVFVGYDGEE